MAAAKAKKSGKGAGTTPERPGDHESPTGPFCRCGLPPGAAPLKTILFGHELTPMEQALALLDALAAQVASLAWIRVGDGEPRRYQCQGCDAERLEWEPGRHADGCEVARLLASVGPPGGLDAPPAAPTPADAPSGPTTPALARRVARRHRPVPCPLDPRFLAWQAAAERFVASLDPANHGRSGPLHCAWEGRYLGGYTSLDVCDGAATTGGNIEADWIRPWGAGDESTIRDWLGEAERRPWDMGIACDGCRGLATVQGAR